MTDAQRSDKDRVLRDAEAAIDLFLEYRDKHGRNEVDAKYCAINEFADAQAYEPRAPLPELQAFGSILHNGKKKGPTAWAKKALEESRKGKRVVLVYPIDKWILMLLAAGCQVRNLGDVRWLATEDRTAGKGTGRHVAAFILNGTSTTGARNG